MDRERNPPSGVLAIQLRKVTPSQLTAVAANLSRDLSDRKEGSLCD